MTSALVTKTPIKTQLDYNPNTGIFKWLIGKGPVKAGSIAGSIDSHGYRQIKVEGKIHLAHRLAWLYTHGGFPAGELDHKNRVRDDNRIDNLRLATRAQNSENTSLRINNTSGFKGVYWDKDCSKWKAQIGYHGKVKSLGRFTNPKDAYAAYCAAATMKFGKFANV